MEPTKIDGPLRPTPSPGSATTAAPTIPTTLIPLSPYFDTLAFLCLMVALPDWIACLLLLSYLLLGSSKVILSRFLALLFTSNTGSTAAHPHHSISIYHLMPALFTSLVIDLLILFISLIAQNQMIAVIRIIAFATIASNLATFRTKTKWNSFLAGSTIIVIHVIYRFAVQQFEIPSYARAGLQQTSLTINHIHYLRKSWRFTLKFIIESINALLSIHICILNSPLNKIFPFTSYTSPLAELSNSITNHYSSNAPAASSTTNPTTLLSPSSSTINGTGGQTPHSKSDTDSFTIEVFKEAAQSLCPVFFNRDDINNVPASYPLEQLSNIEDISSSSTVVSQNFENYCVLPSTNSKSPRKKASVRFSQPLWSLLVAVKTMMIAPDTYSGEDQSGALVQYSRRPLQEIRCFVFMITENAIGLELIGCQFTNEIIVRLNGIIWYQCDTVRFKESTLYVKLSMLTPISEYHVEILNDYGNGQTEYLADLIVSTASSNNAQALKQQQPVRSSPMAMLQQSLETTLENVNREKMNLKKLKREHQKRSALLKSDIDNRNKKLQNEKDAKDYRKIISLRNMLTAHGQELDKLNEELEDYSGLDEVSERFANAKRDFDLRFRDLEKIQKDYKSEKQQYLGEKESLHAETVNLQNKYDRLFKKFTKIVEDLTKIQNELQSLFDSDVYMRKDLLQTLQKKRDEICNRLALESSKLNKQLELAKADNDIARKQANL